MIEKQGNPRDVQFHCGPCDNTFMTSIPFGCFIEMVPGVSAEILEERCGRYDRYISDIFCPVCGVTKFLTMVTIPKKENDTTQRTSS